jgi:2-hydroxychromene-2-carboxylate isomerase
MTRMIAFYYDFMSPYSYLAATQLPALAKRTAATVEFIPVDALSIMALVGNTPTTLRSRAKGIYATADLRRWAKRYGITFTPNAHFRNIDGKRLLAGAAVAAELGEIKAYNRVIFEAIWAKAAALANEAEISGILHDGGVSMIDSILRGLEKGLETIEANVRAAAAAGVFGVPSFLAEGQLFFGNDRLSFLEEALVG